MISVIGVGKVGATFAFLAACSSIDDLVLINRTKNKAVGELLDIINTVPQKSKISIKATGDMSDVKDSKVVVITAGGGTIKEDRTDLLPFNSPMISSIAKDLKKYANESKIVVVTNPVDIMTYQLLKETGFSKNQVIGMGSSLDSSRFRYILAKSQNVNQGQVEGMVIGEHGPTMVPLFSLSKVMDKTIELNKEKKAEIAYEVRNYWRDLHAYKGASVFGAAKHTFDIVEAIVKNNKLSISSSVLLDGEYGLYDMCMGIPVTINKNGVQQINEYSIDGTESDLLMVSAKRIKEGIKKIPNYKLN